MAQYSFNGFPKNALLFFSELTANNNKPWFDEHKSDYENFILAPARDLVVSLGERLQELSPGVIADPRVNKSIFRIYRDVRFSKDKTPYKTHLALWFPTGLADGKFENPGYYFHLDQGGVMLGVGIYMFSKPLLKAYRDSVLDPELGSQLAQITSIILAKGYGIGNKSLQRVPRGYDPGHKYADLLLYSGLTSGAEKGLPAELHSHRLIDFCFDTYRDLAPIVQWLQRMKEIRGV